MKPNTDLLSCLVQEREPLLKNCPHPKDLMRVCFGLKSRPKMDLRKRNMMLQSCI
jgi:hypothetical protein